MFKIEGGSSAFPMGGSHSLNVGGSMLRGAWRF
jgi:hypothetical protein